MAACRNGVREGLDATVDRIKRMHGLQRVLPVVQAHEVQQEQEQRQHEAICATIQARNDAAREAAVQQHRQEVLQVQRANADKVRLWGMGWPWAGGRRGCPCHRLREPDREWPCLKCLQCYTSLPQSVCFAWHRLHTAAVTVHAAYSP